MRCLFIFQMHMRWQFYWYLWYCFYSPLELFKSLLKDLNIRKQMYLHMVIWSTAAFWEQIIFWSSESVRLYLKRNALLDHSKSPFYLVSHCQNWLAKCFQAAKREPVLIVNQPTTGIQKNLFFIHWFYYHSSLWHIIYFMDFQFFFSF